MDQENTKSLNSSTNTPNRNANLSFKNSNSETPVKSSARSVGGSAGGSSSVRRSSRLLKKNDAKSDDNALFTPNIGAPGGTPYLLRSKSRETLSSTEANLRSNAMEMPPLNLGSGNDLGENSEFYQMNTEKHERRNDSTNIYSTPRKKMRGSDENNVNISSNKNIDNTDFSKGLDLETESQMKNSSRRRGGNIKSTPRSKNKRVNEEDSAIKDRKSILKQYDPDGINTATVNIKTPKSQKKVQFGTKNLIIIDENKQDMNINKFVIESDNVDGSRNQDNVQIGELESGRMSILSELDDAGTGQIYNFPSLEELINTKKSEDNPNSNTYNGDIIYNDVSGKNVIIRSSNTYLGDIPIDQSKSIENRIQIGNYDEEASNIQDGNDNSSNAEGDLNVIQDGNGDRGLDLTDQINISDYSINYRDSIPANLPGAFLSEVMKNLSSVNFPDESNKEMESDIRIPKLEINDDSFHGKDLNTSVQLEDSAKESDVLDINEESKEQKHDEFAEDNKLSETHSLQNEVDDKSELKLEEQTQIQQIVVEQTNEEIESDQLVDGNNEISQSIETKIEEISNQPSDLIPELVEERDEVEASSGYQNDDIETQKIVLTETLTILKDSNNRLSSILITPKRNSNVNAGYANKLTPSSEALLKSLNNTKSILNITPQGYTWEEFQTILNLNFTMENYFSILDFNEIGNSAKIKEKNVEEESMDSKLLLMDLQSMLKSEKSIDQENAKQIVSRYSSEVIRSLQNRIWSEIEKHTLIKEFNSQVFNERYTENLSKFSESEIATVMAIIVNKSRYGSKNDEKIKNELFERISKYFFAEDRNIFLKKAIIDWKEKVVFPFKNLLIMGYEEMIKMFIQKHEQLMNNKNRIQNSNVLLSTIESCKISEMHVYETYWNAMKIVHDNINNYKDEIERFKNYLNLMERKKSNISKLLLKEEELYNSLLLELNDWKFKKNSLRHHLNDLRIKEEFAGFTWDLFTINKFQTIIVLNNSCNNQSNLLKVRVSIEWNIDDNSSLSGNKIMDSPPVTLKIELLEEDRKIENSEDDLSANSLKFNDLQFQLALLNNQRLDDKIYLAYIHVIEKTLNLRLIELFLDYKRQNKMNNNILIELIRGIFQSCIVLLWRLESIVFEILNIIKVFNLAIIDIEENILVINIPILVGAHDISSNSGIGVIHANQSLYSSTSNSPLSPLLLTGPTSSSPMTPSNPSPHLLMASRPVISIQFNITNSLFMSIGTLVNSIEGISIYNTNDEITSDMIRVFKDQIDEIHGQGKYLNNTRKNSAVYVGYNCLLSIIQNTVQEGGRNQLIWKRPLEKFAPRLLNAVQISKLHQNF
ncbi:hypothetical protein OJ253_2170 [Cryptosporidium canis]|uniref:Spc7 kinetochore protein domain-containing protein n=1 Tax=Cryptosporidium canis TaxID=195482 RepID=A0A9D5HX84_9CRYT|nr:hypothetical protein OJ253_2170 [Cryptosporidium canis]